MTDLLALEDVNVYYGPFHALRGNSLTVGEGEIVSLLGGNASGKSTTMKTILGLVRPKSGTVRFAGADITHAPTRRRVAGGIASVPEARRVFPDMTVDENLIAGAYTRRSRSRADKAAIAEDLDRMRTHFPRLAERRRQQAGTLSGGEQQMLAVSRALMLRPRLLLLDEPSFGLAPMVVQHLFEIFRTINAQDRIGMLLVEQNASMALRLAQHAYLLETGRVVVSGPAEAIRNDESVRRSYLGY